MNECGKYVASFRCTELLLDPKQNVFHLACQLQKGPDHVAYHSVFLA